MFSVIIPNYNGKKFLQQSLESTNDPLVDEVIIVDNGSNDGSQKYLDSKKVTIIKNKKNLGFARAVNQGIRAAKNDYLVVMNNDLRVRGDWFKIMAEAIKRWKRKEKKIGAYSGKVSDWQGKRIESTGLAFEIKGRSFNRGNGEVDSPSKYNKEEFIFGASASIVIYYKPALLEVGLFDNDFFAYLEDVDLSLRLNDKGWKTIYLPNAIAYHLGGGTANRIKGFRSRMVAKNWWLVIIKNYPLKIFLSHLPEIILERLKNLLVIRSPLGFLWLIKELMIKLPKEIMNRKPIKIKNYEI